MRSVGTGLKAMEGLNTIVRRDVVGIASALNQPGWRELSLLQVNNALTANETWLEWDDESRRWQDFFRTRKRYSHRVISKCA